MALASISPRSGADVTGVTLSTEQWQQSNARAAERRLSRARRNSCCEDYRDIQGRFDRIVSVGMFEHVGVDFYETFFRKHCAALLADDGVMVLHSIGRSEGPDATNPWIAKYIFPGGYIPALSEVLPAIERAGLIVCDIEILRLHYAETLKAWRERFMARGRRPCGSTTSASPDVGILSRLLGNGVPLAEPDELADPARPAPRRRADDAGLHLPRGVQPAGDRQAERVRIAGG